jgi:hypothetical protein
MVGYSAANATGLVCLARTEPSAKLSSRHWTAHISGNFSIRSNNVTGTIPVTGTITEPLDECTRMQIFDIARSSICGTIPFTIGQWNQLFHFGAAEKKLSRSMPKSTAKWTKMEKFSAFWQSTVRKDTIVYCLMESSNIFCYV